MKVIIELEKQIQRYEKERILMNMQQFDQLLKRVNIEESTEIKHRLLNVIEKYVDVLAVQEVQVQDAQPLVAKLTEVVEEVKAPEAPEVKGTHEGIKAVGMIEFTQVPAEKEEDEDTIVVSSTFEIPATEEVKEVPQAEAVVEATELVNEAVVVELPNEVQMTPIAEETVTATVVEEAAPVAVEVTVEAEINQQNAAIEYAEQAVTGEVVEVPAKETVTNEASATEFVQFVENFGLVSTTKDTHIEELLKRGAVLFREKRSFMLALALEDEVLALAKTVKLEQFPKEVRDHLTSNGFITAKVVSVGEIVKKARARNTDITFENIEMLSNDHWIVKNVNNLLDNGEVPDHVKAKQEAEEAKAEPAKAEATQPVAEVQEPAKVEPADNYFNAMFRIHPNFAPIFAGQKEAVMQQQYGVQAEAGTAKLIATNQQGPMAIAIAEKVELAPNLYAAKIIDYVVDGDGKTIDFKLELSVVQPTPPVDKAPVAKATNVEVITTNQMPADFPLVNQAKIKLHPKASEMFNLEQAKAMVGQNINLVAYNTQDTEDCPNIELAFDVFRMGVVMPKLSAGNFHNSKWVARLTHVDLEMLGADKYLLITFDRLEEVAVFAYEQQIDVRDADKFTLITEESFNARQQELAVRQAQVRQTAAQPEQVKQQMSTKVEELMNPNYDPTAVEKALNPNPNANYAQAYGDLVESQTKDIGGAVGKLEKPITPQAQQQVMDKAQQAISGVITQTLTETGIRAKQEEKQPVAQPSTTVVAGNLQDGAGNLSQTDTVIQFVTGYSPQLWAQSVGKQIELVSEMNFGNGPVTSKTVSIIGKNGSIVAQGQAPMNEALLLDGNQHTAVITNVEGGTADGNRFFVSLRLGHFQKKA